MLDLLSRAPVEGPLEIAILGCGARGEGFSKLIAESPDEARVVAIAEPDVDRRQRVGDLHQIPAALRFECWRDLLDRPRLADVIVNTLMDRLHVSSAIKALELGYHMLLEKPMAVTLEDCIAIDEARRVNQRIVSVCHSLRYNVVYREVKRLIESGAIGKIVSIDQLEGVEPSHQAHSFVRGNWSKERESSFMLLTKSCHDMDVLVYLVGSDCARVSSFGSLSHFHKANKPSGSPPRCSDGCAYEAECPHSALKIYGQATGWGRYIGMDRVSQAERDVVVRTTDYGRCVYDAGNDVVDHQVVNFEFANGATGTFTMTAFAPAGRELRIHGTHGYLTASIEKHTIEWRAFWGADKQARTIEVPKETGSHDGGDGNVLRTLLRAIREDDESLVLTGTEESLRTHVVAFAAETARREKRVIEIADFESACRASMNSQAVLV